MAPNDRQVAVADLRLSVYLRAVHPEFFTIQVLRPFKYSAFEGAIWLLETGHVITFIDGSNAVTEVIAPRDLELPQRGLVRSVDLAGGRDHHLDTRGALVYHMTCQVDTEPPGTYLREAEDLLASARQGHVFAEATRDAAKRPFSYAVPEPKGNGLLVLTWHGFPAENTILKTQTLIERGGA